MKKHLFLIPFLCCCMAVNAQTWADTVAAIEKAYNRYKPTDPGAQLAISRNGQVIFSKAWGMADLEHNIPLSTTSLIEAGSVSKQFTAAAILLLEQQGKLSLQDDVHKYIPELPDYGMVVTLRHLMQHVSGLKDWGSVMDVAGWPRTTRAYTNDYALYVISLQPNLNNKPGDEYIYSNSNYNLLATIVKRVSGESLAVFTAKNIFVPAGMTHTQWRDNFRKVVPNRAMAYSRSGTNFFTNMPNEDVYGQGGLLTTAEDLLIWNHYYQSGKLGNPSLFPKQTATSPLNNGRRNVYGAGLVVDSVNGMASISHDGATASYRANLETFTTSGLSFAWLSNTSFWDRDPFNIHNAVRSIFLPRKPVPPPIRRTPPTLAPAKLASYTGWYLNPRTGGGMRLFVKDSMLNSQYSNAVWTPISETAFYAGSARLEIQTKGVLLITGSRDSTFYAKVPDADKSLFPDYAGEYYSKEAEAFYSVIIKEGKLLLTQKPDTEFNLEPTYKEGFESPMGPLYFVRQKGKVTGFKISVSRARNIYFEKK